jgi:hypothetical protein
VSGGREEGWTEEIKNKRKRGRKYEKEREWKTTKGRNKNKTNYFVICTFKVKIKLFKKCQRRLNIVTLCHILEMFSK